MTLPEQRSPCGDTPKVTMQTAPATNVKVTYTSRHGDVPEVVEQTASTTTETNAQLCHCATQPNRFAANLLEATRAGRNNPLGLLRPANVLEHAFKAARLRATLRFFES